MAPLLIVTATTNLDRARSCIESWGMTATEPPIVVLVGNGSAPPTDPQITHAQVAWTWRQTYLGTVPAFRLGVDLALTMAERMPAAPVVIACLHDDLLIYERGWDQKVLHAFEREPACGLLGFGGALGLGSEEIYQQPYNPMQLARERFRSDLVDAEMHGIRSLLPERVACLDGFSQIGRREFWEGFTWRQARLKPHLDRLARELAAEHPDGFAGEGAEALPTRTDVSNRPWHVLEGLGFIHHGYDGALGCVAARYGWEAWYLPVRARHHGGQTAVGDPGYQAWAKLKDPAGDKGLWESAHQIWYDNFRDVLPLRV